MASSDTVVRFDEALRRAVDFVADRFGSSASAVVVVRDVAGRIRLAVDDARDPSAGSVAHGEDLETQFRAHVGAFAAGPGDAVVVRSQMVAPEDVFSAAASRFAGPASGIRVLERLLTAVDWTDCRMPEPAASGRQQAAQRFVFFGIKGGVGRTTALAAVAWHLAGAHRRRVLVVDLDLESPGLGALLLPPEKFPDFGVVDWLVEVQVGQADDVLEQDMARSSPLARDLPGEILVSPACGRLRTGYEYLPKLARAYGDAWNVDREIAFPELLDRMLMSLERRFGADVTLIDSRAGLHDLAAAAVTRFGADSLLFGVDSAQTWDAYRRLLQAWRGAFWRSGVPCIVELRDRLKMVAAMVPEVASDEYLRSFIRRSHDMFAELVYEETPQGDVGEAFNFDQDDEDGPHYPWRINWTQAMQQFDPSGRPEALIPEQIAGAFGGLFRGIQERI